MVENIILRIERAGIQFFKCYLTLVVRYKQLKSFLLLNSINKRIARMDQLFEDFVASRDSISTKKSAQRLHSLFKRNGLLTINMSSEQFAQFLDTQTFNGNPYSVKTKKVYFSELSKFIQFMNSVGQGHLFSLRDVRDQMIIYQQQIEERLFLAGL
jgi:hypothetical protein